MPIVYILRSLKNKKHYIGSTDNFTNRFKAHNNGYGGLYTKINGPWEPLYYLSCKTIKDARLIEKKVKSYKGGNAFKRIINGEVPEWLKGAPC
ncbi:GIY-YIG nuclease family protein [Candidatus Kuenenbacteria bacterium]|nr:GIY-YIG nuclease family protein [Candidatus Kuenenbacteria bacterium]